MKRADAPQRTRSMEIALHDLRLARLAVVYPGTRRYSLGAGIEAVPMENVALGLRGLFDERPPKAGA